MLNFLIKPKWEDHGEYEKDGKLFLVQKITHKDGSKEFRQQEIPFGNDVPTEELKETNKNMPGQFNADELDLNKEFGCISHRSLAKRVREFRRENKLTQMQLSNRVLRETTYYCDNILTDNMISHLEVKGRIRNPMHVAQLAEVMGEDPQEMLKQWKKDLMVHNNLDIDKFINSTKRAIKKMNNNDLKLGDLQITIPRKCFDRTKSREELLAEYERRAQEKKAINKEHMKRERGNAKE